MSKERLMQLRKCLRWIRDFEHTEIAKDEFAYDRLLATLKEAASTGLRIDAQLARAERRKERG